MKKVLTIVIAGLIGIICFGQTPIKKVEKFPNGKIEHEYYVIEYKKLTKHTILRTLPIDKLVVQVQNYT